MATLSAELESTKSALENETTQRQQLEETLGAERIRREMEALHAEERLVKESKE